MKSNPHLPSAFPDLNANHTRQHRTECGPRYYVACLEFSQSLWLQGKPAQAILQLNKAFMAEVSDPPHPLPYQALIWFLKHREKDHFIGNPVRHFQHLATRISGPRAELRSWRAWACFHLAEKSLPPHEFPRDKEQLTKEQIAIPPIDYVLEKLPKGDCEQLRRLHFTHLNHRVIKFGGA